MTIDELAAVTVAAIRRERELAAATETELTEARRDLLAYQELLSAALEQGHQLTVRCRRLTETVARLHDMLRAQRRRDEAAA